MSHSSTGAATSPEARGCLAQIFLSPGDRRLRSGWRLLIHSLLLLIITLPLELATLFIPGTSAGLPFDLLSPLPSLLGITVATILARYMLDRRSFSSLGFKMDNRVVPDLLFGIVLSGLMMGMIFVAEWSLNWVTLSGTALDRFSMPTVIRLTFEALWLYLCVGFSEELLSRGYHLQNLQEGSNTTLAVLVSSGIFGILHLSNPNATLVSTAGIFCAGVFLAYAYLRTQQLWLPIGVHIGWNFFEGTIFGFPVSGLSGFHLLEQTVTGPEWWTGGAFGPEAGLILLPVLLLGTVAISLYTRSRNLA